MQATIQAVRLLISGLLVCAGVLTARASTPSQATTITTTYQYNVDGALTAMTRQVEGEPATTTYLTWDNFTPNVGDATQGMVAAGNGNLLGYGKGPGTADLATRFSFDARDRLTGVSASDQSVVYTYHPTELMASSSVPSEGDSFAFYYEDSRNAQVTNIHETRSEKWSAYLGGVRYVSDGTEQVLLNPRKDVAGIYDRDQKTWTASLYDSYGAPRDAQGDDPMPAARQRGNATRSDGPPPDHEHPPLRKAGLDLSENPFQYAGEYRDPAWGGYYLRARWYDPAMPIFLSRDPVENFSRYAYAGGSPVINVDPSGRSYQSTVGAWSGDVLRTLDTDAGRFFLAPAIGVLQIMANPGGFWTAMKRDKDGTDIFLGAAVLSLIEGPVASSFGGALLSRWMSEGMLLGTAQSLVTGSHDGWNHFDWKSFGQGMEMVLGPEVEAGALGFAASHIRWRVARRRWEKTNIDAKEHFIPARVPLDRGIAFDGDIGQLGPAVGETKNFVLRSFESGDRSLIVSRTIRRTEIRIPGDWSRQLRSRPDINWLYVMRQLQNRSLWLRRAGKVRMDLESASQDDSHLGG